MEDTTQTTEQPTVQPNGEVVTEVTSVAAQEQLTGKKIEIDAADLVDNAKRVFLPIKRQFMSIYGSLSGRGRERVISALLDLPMDNLRVLIKDKKEIEAYRTGQQVLWCRQLILTDAIKAEKKRIEEMKAADAKVSEESTDKTNEEVNTTEESKEISNG